MYRCAASALRTPSEYGHRHVECPEGIEFGASPVYPYLGATLFGEPYPFFSLQQAHRHWENVVGMSMTCSVHAYGHFRQVRPTHHTKNATPDVRTIELDNWFRPKNRRERENVMSTD